MQAGTPPGPPPGANKQGGAPAEKGAAPTLGASGSADGPAASPRPAETAAWESTHSHTTTPFADWPLSSSLLPHPPPSSLMGELEEKEEGEGEDEQEEGDETFSLAALFPLLSSSSRRRKGEERRRVSLMTRRRGGRPPRATAGRGVHPLELRRLAGGWMEEEEQEEGGGGGEGARRGRGDHLQPDRGQQ